MERNLKILEWNESNFNAAVKYLGSASDELKDLQKHFGEKFAKAESFLIEGGSNKEEKTSERDIARGVNSCMKNIRVLGTALKHLNNIVKDAHVNFEEKKVITS